VTTLLNISISHLLSFLSVGGLSELFRYRQILTPEQIPKLESRRCREIRELQDRIAFIKGPSQLLSRFGAL